jgi:hypothetical protein
MKFANVLKKPVLLFASLFAVTVLAQSVPTTAEVKVKSFDYDGSNLSGDIYVCILTFCITMLIIL